MRKNTIQDFWNRVDSTSNPNGCWEWIISGKRIYPGFYYNGECWLIHRLSYTLTKGPIAPGMVVMHSCDNPKCCRPEHLSLGTQLDNMKDRDAKQRTLRGENANSAKLTEQDVLDIRDLYATTKIPYEKLGLKYNVSLTSIYNIIKRNTWKHI